MVTYDLDNVQKKNINYLIIFLNVEVVLQEVPGMKIQNGRQILFILIVD